jgi:RIO kinase 1
MRIPDSLVSLADEGIIEEVLRPLMSGKEAQIYLLRSGGEQRVAKVYKASHERSFRQRAEYTEGRKVRNTRDQRAMAKRTRHGRDQDEAAWRAAEVDMIYRLHAAGVRVPTPYQFIDGVLIMELISDEEGNPAPRLGDVELDRESALQIYDQLLREVVRMLCAGVVHGDLSDFNVLMAPDGPVIIDFPQAVNASSNANARKLLLRDVDNLHRFLLRFVPERRPLPYAEEMWQLYQRGELTPDVRLSGRYRAAENRVNTDSVLGLIADAERDERRRRSNLGMSLRGTTDQPRPQHEPAHADSQQGGAPRGQRPHPRAQGQPWQNRPAHDPRAAAMRGGQDALTHQRHDPRQRGRSAEQPQRPADPRQQGRSAEQPQRPADPRQQGRSAEQPQRPADPRQQGRSAEQPQRRPDPRRQGRGAAHGRGAGPIVVVQKRRPDPHRQVAPAHEHAAVGEPAAQTRSTDPRHEPLDAALGGRHDRRYQVEPAGEAVVERRSMAQGGQPSAPAPGELPAKRKRRRRRRRKGGAGEAGAQAPQPLAGDPTRRDVTR